MTKNRLVMKFSLALPFLLGGQSVFGFVSPVAKHSSGCHCRDGSISFVPTSQRILTNAHASSSSNSDTAAASSEIFVLSFDGAIANTQEWRVLQGIDAALATWPHLKALLGEEEDDHESNGDDIMSDREWLVNKMTALSHVMHARPGSSLSCEYAMLARLLIEEQELDNGRSVGKGGKYASRFHPSSSSRKSQQPQQDESSSSSSSSTAAQQGSRPLTVGEISANWNDGGHLSDTLLVRYNVDGKNPLPILKENLKKVCQDAHHEYPLPPTNQVICDALADCSAKVYVTVGHKWDIDVTVQVLEQSGLQVQIASSMDDMNNNDEEESSSTITLVPHGSDTETKLLRNIICNAKKGTSIFVVNSSWETLQKSKILFGDNIPRLPNAMGRSTFGQSINLSLNLPMWADNTHPTQHNDALMNPWTNLLSVEEELAEIMSARITSS